MCDRRSYVYRFSLRQARLLESFLGSILIATVRFRRVSVARYTFPFPSAPSGACSS